MKLSKACRVKYIDIKNKIIFIIRIGIKYLFPIFLLNNFQIINNNILIGEIIKLEK